MITKIEVQGYRLLNGFVADFSPLRINRKWLAEVASRVKVPVSQVDAHNIVPCWIASQKLEFAAYTLRPKLRRLLNEYLEEIPKLRKHSIANQEVPNNQWEKIPRFLKIDKSVEIAPAFVPGTNAGKKLLSNFVEHKLSDYDEMRNDPCIDGQSNLSPYLHFGQVSAQWAALEATKHRKNEAFLEELIVRRELADNFCFYMPHYDLFEGFHPWAQKTLNEHRKDKREFQYDLYAFELAQTHDPLWNACQKEMLSTGKMHGFMRMYWGKKILEWTESPETALTIAIYLNDKYELDGRDPNGYAGIAWSIGGVHDRAWRERNVYGKIRYMNAKGCVRKFDVKVYVARFG
ncbi:MAG: deoxyribodipyrimidine photolyase [Ignavibacteriales bacterium]|nr:deoxyribodipyrimidine photolyase [Ignavibacteriales bacterium]